jgi:hypothetical protein
MSQGCDDDPGTLSRSGNEVTMRAAVVTGLDGPDAVELLEMPEPEGT